MHTNTHYSHAIFVTGMVYQKNIVDAPSVSVFRDQLVRHNTAKLICKSFIKTKWEPLNAISKWEHTYDNIVDWWDMFKLLYASK